ncbi:hypothetical protein MMJ09_19910, partial [Bacillus vallismortis]|nr:hypothetical protein [Bacillus vallismortis]
LWGADLNEIPRLTERVADHLNNIHNLGIHRALEQCCTQRGEVRLTHLSRFINKIMSFLL